MDRVQVSRPWLTEAEHAKVDEVLRSGWLTKGLKVAEFERLLAAYLGVEHAVAVSSGTTALHLALLALGIGPGDGVIVPAFTFPASANAVLHCGALPALIDIDLRTYNSGAEAVEKFLACETEPTSQGPRWKRNGVTIKAVMPVHLFGMFANMRSILEVTRRHQLRTVEDAACALGAKEGDAYCGTTGDLGCFSFHPRKLITTGEGGLVVTRDAAMAAKMRSLRNHGASAEGGTVTFPYCGYNYRLSEIHAAIGIAQMDKLETIIRRHAESAGWYDESLAGDARIATPAVDPGRVYQAYVVQLQDSIDRQRVIADMGARGIECVGGAPSLCEQPPFSDVRTDCPQSARAAHSSLALPLHTGLQKDAVGAVCEALRQVLGT